MPKPTFKELQRIQGTTNASEYCKRGWQIVSVEWVHKVTKYNQQGFPLQETVDTEYIMGLPYDEGEDVEVIPTEVRRGPGRPPEVQRQVIVKNA